MNELWLFCGKAEQRTFKATFAGVKTRRELIDDYGYPYGDESATKDTKDGRARCPQRAVRPPSRPHGTHYALFKVETKYRHKLAVPEDAERVIIRASDFAHRSPKIAKQLKAWLESSDRRDPDLAKRLPEIVSRLRPDQLRVCEAAAQMALWNLPNGENMKPKVPFPPPKNPKFTFIDLFAGIGGFRIAMQNCGGECVFTSEFDPAAQKTYEANFGDVPCGDITKQETHDKIPAKFDIVCAGFPCQAFSLAGKRLGFKDLYKGISLNEISKKVA